MTKHLITSPAELVNCPRCGALTFTAITGGLTTVTDAEPLTVNEEIAVRLTGGTTFDLTVCGRSVFIQWRDLARIRAGRDHLVAALHQCGPRGGAALPVPAAPVPAASLPDDPPF